LLMRTHRTAGHEVGLVAEVICRALAAMDENGFVGRNGNDARGDELWREEGQIAQLSISNLVGGGDGGPGAAEAQREDERRQAHRRW